MDLLDKEPLKEPLAQTIIRVTTLNRRAKGRQITGMRFHCTGNNSKNSKSLIVSSWEDLDNLIQNSDRTGT